MKVAIVGVGAMGSVYAGLLAAAGHEVWASDTWGEHIDAIRKNGLRVEGASGDRTVRVHATTQPAEAGICDLVIIATKAMHVAAAAESVKPLLGPQTVVLSIQNGLGGPDTAASVPFWRRVSKAPSCVVESKTKRSMASTLMGRFSQARWIPVCSLVRS
jgi:2-dehydropantoate 2-reductase